MGRTPRYGEDVLLDAACGLVAQKGPAAVTMTAVAREAGAPSGSLYHRFPDRPALLAALWIRTVSRFQAGFVSALDSTTEIPGLIAAARYVVSWCRRNPADATVLLWGAESFGQADWVATDRGKLQTANDRTAAALRDASRRVDAVTAVDKEFVELAVVEVPLTIVRRGLRSGLALDETAETLAEEAARALLYGVIPR